MRRLGITLMFIPAIALALLPAGSQPCCFAPSIFQCCSTENLNASSDTAEQQCGSCCSSKQIPINKLIQSNETCASCPHLPGSILVSSIWKLVDTSSAQYLSTTVPPTQIAGTLVHSVKPEAPDTGPPGYLQSQPALYLTNQVFLS